MQQQSRRLISTVPDGTYTYSDYMEGDAVGLGLLRIKLSLKVNAGTFLMDLLARHHRCAPRSTCLRILNGHWMMITGLVNWLCTREPTISYNAGLVRPFKLMHRPDLINPEEGAACGARYSTSHKVCDIIGALSQAVPNQLPATDSGQAAILLVAMPDRATSRTRVSVIQPLVGGSGARPSIDGVDGTMVILNFLKNVPTELLSGDARILIRKYGYERTQVVLGNMRWHRCYC